MKQVTDQALFGKSVGQATPQPIVPLGYHNTKGETCTRIEQPKPAEKEFSVAMTVFRIQQSLCLFPLGESHFKHPGEKLKYLLSERGLFNKGRETDLNQVTAELVRQSKIMAEAVSKYEG